MKDINPALIQLIKRCQGSATYWIDNFCKIEHPKAGIIPFKLWSYQRQCLKDFQENRFCVFRKCRQSGISTLTGAFALWLAMFFNNKTILIVSKRDEDAKAYLRRNVKFIYDHLPVWMKELWPAQINVHSVTFKNGSMIRSLTSSPDTLRSNASSLNIIDEVAFIEKMEEMWKGGWSTLQHGGNCLLVSTPKGHGNFYYKTWQKAITGQNNFHPIEIKWHNMDWEVEFVDEFDGVRKKISPTSGLVKLSDKEEIEKYGEYWSPWLESQYKELASKGDDSGFRQEILAEFIGSGDTVLKRSALLYVKSTVVDKYKEIGMVDYRNPALNEASTLNFKNALRIWKPPYKGDSNNSEDRFPHMYVVGADPAGGEPNRLNNMSEDYSCVQVFDITTKEQVAELQIRVLPKIFARMVDWIGRYYNNALVVCERTGLGQAVCQELNDFIVYPNLFRQRKQASSLKYKYTHIGYATSGVSKHTLIKHLVDNIGDEDGFIIRSQRLYDEMTIFINLPGGKYGNEPGVGNHDDLVMSTCLALVAIEDAVRLQSSSLIPHHSTEYGHELSVTAEGRKQLESMILRGGKETVLPVNVSSEFYTNKPNPQKDLAKFITQLGGIPIDKNSRRLSDGQLQDPTRKKKDFFGPSRG